MRLKDICLELVIGALAFLSNNAVAIADDETETDLTLIEEDEDSTFRKLKTKFKLPKVNHFILFTCLRTVISVYHINAPC